MADLPAKEAVLGLRLRESNPVLKPDLLAKPETTAARGSAFTAALNEGDTSNASLGRSASSPNGAEGTARPDFLVRPDTTTRSDAQGRPDRPSIPNAQIPVTSTLDSLDGETSDLGKINLPVLQLGSSDRAVLLLQRALILLGYPMPPPSEVFDGKTEQAVRAFQEAQGLLKDGIVGKSETWPALNQSLVTRYEGVTRLADALGPTRALPEPQAAEMKQMNVVLAEFAERMQPATPAMEGVIQAVSAEKSSAGDVAYTVRGGETLSDVARTFGLPVAALVAANPELSKPYLILQGQLLTVPNPVKERKFRKPPRQLHPADPEGHLSHANMNPDFVALVNGMIEQLRGEGHDVRVIDGFRSFDQQQRRFDQGRRVPGNILTDAEGGYSWHNYGLAVDIVLNDDDGRPAWPEESSIFWQRLGDVALAHGVIWGGLFGSPAHIEYHPQFERDEAGSLIEDFESHGLELIWERIALELPPEA